MERVGECPIPTPIAKVDGAWTDQFKPRESSGAYGVGKGGGIDPRGQVKETA